MSWEDFIFDAHRRPEKPWNRVLKNEGIAESVDRIPFLEQFFLGANIVGMSLVPFASSMRVNEYMGRVVAVPGRPITSDLINELLEEAEKRGDLHEKY